MIRPDTSIRDHNIVETLYQRLTDNIHYRYPEHTNESDDPFQTEEQVRAVLDAIYSMGKIAGRLSAVPQHIQREDDSLVRHWADIVKNVTGTNIL